MNKSEVISEVAAKAGVSKADATSIINTYQNVIIEALSKGVSVSMIGFGAFEVKERAARTGRNPRTGEPLEIAASKSPVFKAGKVFKEAVKNS